MSSPRSTDVLAELDRVARHMERDFREGRRVLSFQQYLSLFAAEPVALGRDASRYVRDLFDHYGTRTVQRPFGQLTRWRLFDLPWETADAREAALVGQEEVQAEIYRVLCNFAREGRPNRLLLLHGPNGSAKSTVAACILSALEHYSTLDAGALYRFHWVFPSRKTVRGSIGFGGDGRLPAGEIESFANLEEEQIDARLVMEIRDHPMFLLPVAHRRELVERLYREAGAPEPPPSWLVTGRLCHKNQQIFEALLSSYGGSLAEVLRHVQVERYFISRRYRQGAVTLGPALSVDAGERQITMDRSVASLPTSLQATTLFEAHGELVEAAGGVLEFSDLLKRPLDTYRYLQLTLETGEVALKQQNVQTNVIMLGSANEVHLAAFREHPEFPSFRGRLELIRAPYLRSYLDEQQIYDAQIAPHLPRHVAPHATRAAAMFAVLTRMRQPEPKRYPDALAPVVSSLTAVEKMELFATGQAPERLDAEAQKVLRAGITAIYREGEALVDYEGRLGVSPREMRTVLLDASQHPGHACLSPFAVLDELDELCTRVAEYDWLKEKPLSGGYHDHRLFREVVRERVIDAIEGEMREMSGLVDEARYSELFDRYVMHVGVWVKGEKIRNPHTGEFEPPDERMMREVEALLGVKNRNEEFRRAQISAIAAWAIDHPGEKVVNTVIFPHHLRKLRDSVFAERRRHVALLVRDLVTLLCDEGRGLDATQRREAEATFERLQRIGYCEGCARDAASALLRARYGDLVT